MPWGMVVIRDIYFLTMVLSVVMLAHYAARDLRPALIKALKWTFLVFYAAVVVLVLLNHWTGVLYTVTPDGGYIRSPANVILYHVALASTYVDDPEAVRDYLSKISTSGQHLLILINDVLDMSRIESGRVKIEEKEVHLTDVMHDLRTIVNANIISKNIEFLIDAVDIENESILCDKLRFDQVLLDLLSNVIKYTKNGGQIIVRIIRKPDYSNGYATYEFHVKDNGIGMSKEFQKHLFEAFTREESTTVSGIRGTGHGMAISKNIVDMMGGTISVESEEGKGTEYTVSIPFKVLSTSAKYEVVPQLQGVRVLVADDDSNTAISVSRMVQEIGMRSEWALSGKEAVLPHPQAHRREQAHHHFDGV